MARNIEPKFKPPEEILEYFKALRTEISEQQKQRVQVGLTKTVFVGVLLGYFMGEKGEKSIAVLVVPWVALAFDFMVFGLSHNIGDLGRYIRAEIEPAMTTPGRAAVLWQAYRDEREQERREAAKLSPIKRISEFLRNWNKPGVKSRRVYLDQGRIAYRVGNYSLSGAVAVLSFIATPSGASNLLILLVGAPLALGWGVLFALELRRATGADWQPLCRRSEKGP